MRHISRGNRGYENKRVNRNGFQMHWRGSKTEGDNIRNLELIEVKKRGGDRGGDPESTWVKRGRP